MARVPMGALVALLFTAGAYRVSTTEDSTDGAALMAVALILVGIWITLELHDKFKGE